MNFDRRTQLQDTTAEIESRVEQLAEDTSLQTALCLVAFEEYERTEWREKRKITGSIGKNVWRKEGF